MKIKELNNSNSIPQWIEKLRHKDRKELHPNLRNSFANLCKQVAIHDEAEIFVSGCLFAELGITPNIMEHGAKDGHVSFMPSKLQTAYDLEQSIA